MKRKNNKICISFTGDILCDFPELKYMKQNHYTFDEMFVDIKLKTDKEELLIGNLETPICPYLPYTFEPFSFNSPPSFVKSLSKLGFDLVSVANNHCLDRGALGAKSTLKYLKKNNIIPSGIYYDNEKNYDIIKKNDIKIAFISYTYGTNYNHNHYYLKKNNQIKVNLLKPQNNQNAQIYNHKNYIYTFIKNYIKHTLLWKTLANIKHKIKKDTTTHKKAMIIDNIGNDEWVINETHLNNLKTTIENAKKEADIVILLLHSGGQFNKDVGTFTKKLVDNISKMPVDLIIGNHPHIVQQFKLVNAKPVFYSLGNFIFSPHSEYINFTYKPDYSLKINCYIDNNKKISFTFNILKTIAHNNNHATIQDTFDLYNTLNETEKKSLISDCNFIINRLYNTDNIKYIETLKNEYILETEV